MSLEFQRTNVGDNRPIRPTGLAVKWQGASCDERLRARIRKQILDASPIAVVETCGTITLRFRSWIGMLPQHILAGCQVNQFCDVPSLARVYRGADDVVSYNNPPSTLDGDGGGPWLRHALRLQEPAD